MGATVRVKVTAIHPKWWRFRFPIETAVVWPQVGHLITDDPHGDEAPINIYSGENVAFANKDAGRANPDFAAEVAQKRAAEEQFKLFMDNVKDMELRAKPPKRGKQTQADMRRQDAEELADKAMRNIEAGGDGDEEEVPGAAAAGEVGGAAASGSLAGNSCIVLATS